MSALKSLKDTVRRKYKLLSKISISIIGICAARAIYCYIHRKHNKYPPGPMGLPFIGNLFSMANPVKLESYLATTYGPISMIYVAKQPFIFLHSVDSINEILSSEHALERDEWGNSFEIGYLKPYELSTVDVGAPFWMKKRKTFQSVLLSRLDSQFLIVTHNESITQISQSIQNCIKHNKLWYPSKDLEYIMFNAIWSASFGSSLPSNSVIQAKITDFISIVMSRSLLDMAAMQLRLKKIMPSSWSKWLMSFFAFKKLCDYVESLIYSELKYDQEIWNMNDLKWAKHFEDVLCDDKSCLISKLIAVHRSKPGIDSTKNALLADVCTSLFLAGTETTQNVAEYGLVLLGKYPKDQAVIYNEIYCQFGDDWKMEQKPFKSVIHKLHYLRAFIHETLRLSAVVPFGLPHRNNKDIWTKDKKYKIPVDSVIISDIYSANKCVEKSFCLESWLNDENEFCYNLNKDKMASFSRGPRDCAGKAFALRSLYILFSKLVLNFQFKLAEERIEIKQRVTFTHHIHPPIGLKVTRR